VPCCVRVSLNTASTPCLHTNGFSPTQTCDLSTMPSMSPLFQSIVIYLLAHFISPKQYLVYADGTASIQNIPIFSSQRPCAQNCVWWDVTPINVEALLAGSLGCQLSPIENDCLCRTDLQPSATSYLQTCVSTACNGNTQDIQSAQSIYLSYCSSNGYLTASTTQHAASTAGQQPAPGKGLCIVSCDFITYKFR
jgi:hypothetical protein